MANLAIKFIFMCHLNGVNFFLANNVDYSLANKRKMNKWLIVSTQFYYIVNFTRPWAGHEAIAPNNVSTKKQTGFDFPAFGFGPISINLTEKLIIKRMNKSSKSRINWCYVAPCNRERKKQIAYLTSLVLILWLKIHWTWIFKQQWEDESSENAPCHAEIYKSIRCQAYSISENQINL